MNGFVYEIRIMQSIEFYLLSLSCLVSLFTFTDYTLHHAKQQQEQIDDMFGQFIIMRKSKFENIAGIAGVCQKVLPIFRRCLKNEKGVANWNWVTVFTHKCQCSRLSSIIGLQNNSNSVDCKVLIKPAMHNLLPRSLNWKWKFAEEHLHFAQKSLRLFGVNGFNAIKSCINFNYINDFMLQYLWAQPPSARGGGAHGRVHTQVKRVNFLP